MFKSKTTTKEPSGQDKMQAKTQMHGKVVSAAAVPSNHHNEGRGGAPDDDHSNSSNKTDEISYHDKALLKYSGDLQLTVSVIRANDLVDKGHLLA